MEVNPLLFPHVRRVRPIGSHRFGLRRVRVGAMERAEKVATILAKMNESWDSLLHTVPTTQFVLLDPQPDASGHMSRLRITVQQRDDLVKSIDVTCSKWTRRIVTDNRPIVELAAIYLWEFLTKKGYTLRK